MMPQNLGVLASWRENSKIWCRRLLVLSLVLITIATVIPHGSEATITVPVVSVDLDKVVHFLGFAALLLLAFAAGKDLSFWRGMRIAVYVLFYGIAIEVVQYYIPYRTFNPVDIFANSCGVAFGVLIWIVAAVQKAPQLNTLRGDPVQRGRERIGHSRKKEKMIRRGERIKGSNENR